MSPLTPCFQPFLPMPAEKLSTMVGRYVSMLARHDEPYHDRDIR